MTDASHYIKDDADYVGEESSEIAWVAPAKQADAEKLLASDISNDGRSDWKWLRLRDGTLILGVFPCGDTYMEFSDSGVCDFGGDTGMTDKPNIWTPDRTAWLQGIFDTGARGLITQGHKSDNENGECCYRGPERGKCALGFSITDDKYNAAWDTDGGGVPYIKPALDLPASVRKRSISIAEALGCKTEYEATALRDLQMCHDNADPRRFVSDVKGRMQHFAMKYNLNPAVLFEGAT